MGEREMRMALVSDIHGNLAALEAVIADLKNRAVDRVFNLGDHVSGPLYPKETAKLLMAQDWVHLAGNHERQLLTTPASDMGPSDAFAYGRLDRRELSWMANQAAAGGLDDVLLCHGTPEHDDRFLMETEADQCIRPATPEELMERLGSTEASLIACGHSHIPRILRAPSGQTVVNPGSVGLPAYETDTSVVQTGFTEARYAVVEKQQKGWRIDMISLPYDHHAMAETARRHGRADWAEALSTGYLNRLR